MDKYEKRKEFYQKKILPHLDKILIGLIVIGFCVLGFFSSMIPIYYFGLIFFFAGFYAGGYGPKVFGLIFLFSHGGTGLSLMIYSLCKDYFNNPRFTDAPYFMTYVAIVAFIILLATAFVFVCNLTNPFLVDDRDKRVSQKNKWYKFIPLSLYLLGVALTVVFLRMI